MIQVGDVAFLKTTGEAVFVKAKVAEIEGYDDLGMQYEVRRPLAGQMGITHATEYFYLAELESLDEQRARFVAERQEVMKKYGPSAQPTSIEDFGSIPN